MVTKTKILCLFLLIAITSLNTTCRKGKLGCATQTYSFEAAVKAYSDKDSLAIGDTIWMEINSPTLLHDKISGHLIDYSGASNLGTAIDFLAIKPGSISAPGSVEAAEYFDYYLVKGIFIHGNLNPQKIKEFNLVENEGHYILKVGFIPKKRGEFIIAPGNAANVYREQDKCTKASFSITFSNTDQHLYFYQDSRPGYEINEYEKTHLYCFKVY